jgi:hypothetical protein
MQQKSIDENVGVEDFNKKVFQRAMELIYYCKKINISNVTDLHRYSSIKKKYNEILEKLHNMLNILRNFTDA